MNWKPHTEHPDHAPESVLIAGYDILAELYIWNGSNFLNEVTGFPVNPDIQFWWILESELL